MDIDAATIHLPPMARFAIVMFLILATPYTARRLRIPAVVGYILVGILIGPHLLSVLPGNSKVADFFAELGKLLLMFFVGLEIDMQQFREHRSKSLVFGLTTFALPLATGIAAGLAFGYPPLAALLIGSLLASHTLIAYPIVQKAGLTRLLPVTVTVGATILTDMLSLLLLAVCVTTHKTGFNAGSLAIQLAELGLGHRTVAQAGETFGEVGFHLPVHADFLFGQGAGEARRAQHEVAQPVVAPDVDGALVVPGVAGLAEEVRRPPFFAPGTQSSPSDHRQRGEDQEDGNEFFHGGGWWVR